MLPPGVRREGAPMPGNSGEFETNTRGTIAIWDWARRRAGATGFATLQLAEFDFDEPESEAAAVAGLLSGALLSAGFDSAPGVAFAESAPAFDSVPDSEDGALFEA